MKLSNPEKLQFSKGTDHDRKVILQKHLEMEYKILKSSPDINILQKSQGRIEVMEEILSTFN